MNENKNKIIIQSNNPSCKSCGSTHTRKYGLYKGVQRYFCNDCGSKFKADDTTFHMKLDANMVSSTLNTYYDGLSIREIRRHLLQEHQHAPSTATIYEWIQKYTQYAQDSVKDIHPKVGDVWVADETVLKIGGENIWLWDIIDQKTRFLLATRLSRSRTTQDAQMMMDRAVKLAGKRPKSVVTDQLASYLNVRFEDTEHKQGSPFRPKDSGESTSHIERFHGTFKDRTKVMRGLKSFETAHEYTQGWLVNYNFIRPHEGLNYRTPAQEAGIEYPYKNWAEIIRYHKPTARIIIEHQPRESVRMRKAWRSAGRPPKVTTRKPKATGGVIYGKLTSGGAMYSRRPRGRGRRRVA